MVTLWLTNNRLPSHFRAVNHTSWYHRMEPTDTQYPFDIKSSSRIRRNI